MAEESIELRKIRGHAWVEHCMKLAGCKQAGLIYVTSAVRSPSLWSKYKTGKVLPEPETVKVVDQVLPGTAITWNSGPEGLPLWSVLNGYEDVCNDFVNTELADQVSRSVWWLLANKKRPISSMTMPEKIQAMLEASIPDWFWFRKPGKEALPEDQENFKYIDLRFANRDEFFLTLEEAIKQEPNALAAAYAEGVKKYKNPENRFAKYGFGIGEYRILEKKRLVAFISLIVLCGKERSKRLGEIHAFLKIGIHQALVDNFGVAVADYVKSPLNI